MKSDLARTKNVWAVRYLRAARRWAVSLGEAHSTWLGSRGRGLLRRRGRAIGIGFGRGGG